MENHLGLPLNNSSDEDSSATQVRMDCEYLGDCGPIDAPVSFFDSLVTDIKSFFGCSE